jgi:ferrous iron transport protein A
MKKLNDLKLNEIGKITSVMASTNIKRRLMDIGFVKGSIVRPILNNFSNEMVAYSLKGTVMALRKDDTSGILVEVIK